MVTTLIIVLVVWLIWAAGVVVVLAMYTFLRNTFQTSYWQLAMDIAGSWWTVGTYIARIYCNISDVAEILAHQFKTGMVSESEMNMMEEISET